MTLPISLSKRKRSPNKTGLKKKKVEHFYSEQKKNENDILDKLIE